MFAGKRLFLFGMFLLVPKLWCAGTTVVVNAPLTVLVDFEAPHSEVSLETFRQSLNQILSPGGFEVDVKLKQDVAPDAQFGQLVIFKMKGSCSMKPINEPGHRGLPIDDRGPLAMAYTSDGQVLHFGEVECDHIRHTLERVLGMSSSVKNQQAYGTALAVVVAHEVYHMLGNAVHHTQKGLTKATLSASELTDEKLSLPANAISVIHQHLHGLTATEPE